MLRRKSRNEKELEQSSHKNKKKRLQQLKKGSSKEIDLRVKEEKKLQDGKKATLLEKAHQRQKDIQDQIVSLEEQK